MAEDIDQRKLLSALAHGSNFFSSFLASIIVPVAIILATDDQVTKKNAKAALNFQLTFWLYGIILFILAVVSFFTLAIGILPVIIIFGIFLAVFNLIMPIIGILQVLTNPYKSFHYPLTFKIF